MLARWPSRIASVFHRWSWHITLLLTFVATPCLSLTNLTCRDTLVGASSEPWKADQQEADEREQWGLPRGDTCASISATSDLEKHFQDGIGGVPALVTRTIVDARIEAAFYRSVVDGIVEAVFLVGGILLNFTNPCTLSPINKDQAWSTGTSPLTAAEACCACGGGSTFNQSNRYPETRLALERFYNSTNGPVWDVQGGVSE